MMNRLLNMTSLVAGLLLTLCLVSPAQADNLSKAFDTCMSKAQANVEMMNCIDDEIKRQDDRLNKVYKALRDDVDESRRPALLAAQRAWIQFRDLNCKFHLDPDGGTMAPLLAADCMMRMTADRAEELAQLLPPEDRFPIAAAAVSAPAAPAPAAAPARTVGSVAQQLANDMGAERSVACLMISAKMIGALLRAAPGSDQAAMRDGFMGMSKVYGGLLEQFPQQVTSSLQPGVSQWVKANDYDVLSPYFDKNCADPRVYELAKAGYKQ
jgi:uncharacterized protein YecT (DUF1311 family)